MIQRHREIKTLRELLKRHPVVGIVGAHQVGKTTLARTLIGKIDRRTSYFDLENPEDLARLTDPTKKPFLLRFNERNFVSLHVDISAHKR